MFSLKGLITGIGITVLTKKFVDLTLAQAKLQDETIKAARGFGIQVEQMVSLGRSFELGGASLVELNTGMRRLTRNTFDAAAGTGEAKKAFDELGVAVKNADGTLRNANDIIFDIADSFQKLEDGTKKSALAQLIFGRAGGRLINTLNLGSEALIRQRKEAEKLGIIFSKEGAVAAEEFNDAITDLGFAFQGAFRELGDELLPQVTKGIKDLTNFIAENRSTITEFGVSLFNAFNVALPVITAVGGAIKDAAKFWSDFITELGESSRIENIVKASTELVKVRKELEEQRAILKVFEKSGFIPPSIIASVESLTGRVTQLKDELKSLRDVARPETTSASSTEDPRQAVLLEREETFLDKKFELNRDFELDLIALGLETESKKIQADKDELERAKLLAQQKQALTIQTAGLAVSALKDIFGENKAFAIADIGVNTARGVQRSFADLPPPFNFIQAGLIGASGVAQAAKVSSQKFANGGIVEGPGTNRSDSIPISVSPGEGILNQATVQRIGAETVAALNNGGGAGSIINLTINAGAGTDLDSLAQVVTNAVQRATQLGLEPSVA